MGRGDRRASKRKSTSAGAKRPVAPIIHHQLSFISSGGFTLIELLVVISIIALLLAVLLPTLGRVRKQARAVACQASLRQWDVAFFMYRNEYNEKMDRRTWMRGFKDY